MNDFTTIAVGQKTKKRMDDAKIHPRETYDDLINRLLDEKQLKEKGKK